MGGRWHDDPSVGTRAISRALADLAQVAVCAAWDRRGVVALARREGSAPRFLPADTLAVQLLLVSSYSSNASGRRDWDPGFSAPTIELTRRLETSLEAGQPPPGRNKLWTMVGDSEFLAQRHCAVCCLMEHDAALIPFRLDEGDEGHGRT